MSEEESYPSVPDEVTAHILGKGSGYRTESWTAGDDFTKKAAAPFLEDDSSLYVAVRFTEDGEKLYELFRKNAWQKLKEEYEAGYGQEGMTPRSASGFQESSPSSGKVLKSSGSGFLSERVKNWIAGPKALIAVSSLVGLVGWGGAGLVIGAVGGLVASLVIGVVIKRFAGGMISPQVRRELAESVALRYPDVVETAYPRTPKTEWVETLEEDAESIAERAVDLAPSHEMVWSEGNVLRAVEELAEEQDTEGERELYVCIGKQIAQTWYRQTGE